LFRFPPYTSGSSCTGTGGIGAHAKDGPIHNAISTA